MFPSPTSTTAIEPDILKLINRNFYWHQILDTIIDHSLVLLELEDALDHLDLRRRRLQPAKRSPVVHH